MTDENKQTVYVVTRNNRRIEDCNYKTQIDAEERAEALVAMLKRWNDPDQRRVKVVSTSSPSKIR